MDLWKQIKSQLHLGTVSETTRLKLKIYLWVSFEKSAKLWFVLKILLYIVQLFGCCCQVGSEIV